jgi:hypothetical protein
LDARLKSADRAGLSKVDRAVMVAREAGALLMVGVGLVNPLGSPLPIALEGEFMGLSSGNRDMWATGGVLTGSEGSADLKGFFVGEMSRALAGMLDALRALVLRVVDAGRLGGPIELSTLKVDFVLAGDGVGEMSDKVSMVLSDNERRGLRLTVAGWRLACWSPARSKSWTLFSSRPVTSGDKAFRGGGVVSSSVMLAGRLLASRVALLEVGLVVDFREAGAPFAFAPFLDAGTLFVHSPSGAGAAKHAWPALDGLGCDAVLDDVLDDCALCCLLGDTERAVDSMPSPGGRAGSRERGMLPILPLNPAVVELSVDALMQAAARLELQKRYERGSSERVTCKVTTVVFSQLPRLAGKV